jgi:glycosyltransferase involved in cell wall biosynthesis
VSRPRRRLGVYFDAKFARPDGTPDGRPVVDPADLPFLVFVSEVAAGFDELVLFGRTGHGDDIADPLDLPGPARLVELPDYPDLRHLRSVVAAAAGTVAAFARGLRHVDVVWVLGPHPFGLLLVVLALLARREVVLGVRQDTVPYFRSRMPDRRWAPSIALAHVLDRSYRLLGRFLPVTVVGEALAGPYRGPGRRVHPMTVSLVPAARVAARPGPPVAAPTISLLTVGRIEPEKNPDLLLDVMADLEQRHPGRFRLQWIGTGFLAGDVARRITELGLGHVVDLVGYLPFGPDLLDRYGRADAFVHVSLTEGVPQVLIEAMASGLPIVATDVGGVREAVGDAAVLVPPADHAALAAAVEHLADDAALGTELAARGLERARDLTLEAQAAAVAAFIGHR